MKDYWSKLQLNECWSQKERYNILLNYIDSKISSDEVPVEEETIDKELYYFKSYGDAEGTLLWGVGSVETTGIVSNGFTEIEVLTNNTDPAFVGQKFYIETDAEVDNDDVYELFSDDGSTSANLYVRVYSSEPLCTISVNVVDNDGGVNNANVVFTSEDNEEYTGTTGNAGGCTVKNVPYGEYTYTVNADGYDELTGNATIDNDTVEVNVTLSPSVEQDENTD